MLQFVLLFILSAGIAAGEPGTQDDSSASKKSGTPSLNDPSSPEEINQLIRQLSDSSYAKRTYATQRLCAIGMDAYEPLKKALQSDDAETALRASELIHTLNQLLFSGIEITLSLSKNNIAWNESIDLVMTLKNVSSHTAKIPFDKQITLPRQKHNHAQQVASMLDVAEWIHVRHPQGQEMTLSVDDFAADPAIVDIVHLRLDDGPFMTIEPQQQITLTAYAFNRGWARYKLLDEGEYTVWLDYVPEWDDKKLADAQIGRVTSKEIALRVDKPAPDTISRSGQIASLSIHQDKDKMYAKLINRTDQTMILNTNLGDQPPFAQARWIYRNDDQQCEHLIMDQIRASWHDFDQRKLIEVQPGHSHVLTRINLDVLREKLIEAGADKKAESWALSFSYSNLCDWRWQRRQAEILQNNPNAPEFLQKPLPPKLSSARYTSNELIVTMNE